MTSALGTLLALLVLMLGIALKGGPVLALLNPGAFLVVFGGTFAALLVQTPRPTLLAAWRLLPWVYRPPVLDTESRIQALMGWCLQARRKGVLKLEPAARDESDPLLKKGLQMLVDGANSEQLKAALEMDAETQERQAMKAVKVFEHAGVYSPTMGILGAVMGLISVMQDLANTEHLGQGIASAFVATIYGVGLANLWLLPVAAKLKNLVHEQFQLEDMSIAGLVGIAENTPPWQLEATLRGLTS